MKTLLSALMDKAKGNPVATALGAVAFAVWGGGDTLSAAQVEPWGTLVQGCGALLALV